MKKRSLRFSLGAWSTFLVAGIFTVFGSGVYLGLENYLVKSARESLITDAQVIGAELVQQVDQNGENYVVANLSRRYSSQGQDQFVRILRGDGSLLYQSSPGKYGGFDPRRVPVLKLNDQRRYSTEFYLPDHHRLLIEGLSVTTPKGASYLIEMGSLYLYIEGVLNGVLFAMFFGLLLFIGTGIVGTWILIRRALRPVDQITKLAEQITSSRLSERLPVTVTGDEMERLALSLNKMIARLEGAFLHVNRFSADVSHELRTPLTILRGELEELAQQPNLPVQLLDNVSSALDETERLTRIVDHLLTLSRLDSEMLLHKERILLDEIARTTTGHMKLLADEKSVSIEIETVDRVAVEGDPVRIGQLIANLLDNAIKYARPDGYIKVKTYAEGDRAIFEVADDGVGVPADALPHVFERFYRVDKSRSRASGGAGLGLAIVKAICIAHSGDVKIESVEHIGTRVTVTLPLIKEAAAQIDSRSLSESGTLK